MNILFVSGGSAGHLAPLIAVEKAVKAMKPKTKTFFLCSDKPSDADYLSHEGVPFSTLPIPKKNIFFPIQYVRNLRGAKKVLQEFKPDVVFSKGGAVSVPVCKAAYKAGIPVVIHESDSVMGKANAYVAKFASAICLGFSPSDDQLMFGTKPVVTGNPIRPDIAKGSKKRGLELTHFTGKHPVLLVLGGSQGATALNDAIIKNIDELLRICDIVHLTGKGKNGAKKRAGYFPLAFAHEELKDLYAIADLALCRAGAGTISELVANEIPMILCPIRGLANDHQYENAVRVERSEAGIIISQDMLNRDLVSVVQSLFTDRKKLLALQKKAAELQQEDPARRVAKILFECLAPEKKND